MQLPGNYEPHSSSAFPHYGFGRFFQPINARDCLKMRTLGPPCGLQRIVRVAVKPLKKDPYHYFSASNSALLRLKMPACQVMVLSLWFTPLVMVAKGVRALKSPISRHRSTDSANCNKEYCKAKRASEGGTIFVPGSFAESNTYATVLSVTALSSRGAQRGIE